MSNETQSALNAGPESGRDSSLASARYAPREGVYIPCKQVRKMRRVCDLLDDAQRRARDLLRQAEQQAVDMRRQAFAAGYEDGALAAASHVLAHFDAAQEQAEQLRTELERHARALLGEALDHPDAVLAVLDQCLQGLAGPPGQAIRIRLPQSMRGLRARLERSIAQAGQDAVEIGYHDDSRLIVLYGEKVFEFDPPVLIEQGQRSLLASCPDLAQQRRQLGDAAAARWHEDFAQRFIASGAASDDASNALFNEPENRQ
jgi:hypothetical protein